MKNLADQHILILGLGASGLALARWCVRCGAQVTVADTRSAPPQLARLREEVPAARFVTSQMDAALLDTALLDAALLDTELPDAALLDATLRDAAVLDAALPNSAGFINVNSAGFAMVLKSPGLSPASVAGVMNAAQARGIACGNELSLFAQALADLKETQGYAPKVIAITGTNGKTTVTSLTGQLVERAGKTVAVAGNIGPTLLDTLTEKLDAASNGSDNGNANGSDNGSSSDNANSNANSNDGTDAAQLLPDVWVLELSSFQLDGITNFEPSVATVLNITQDHLDWHETLNAYSAAKAQVFGREGLMLLNRDDALVMAMLPAPLKGKPARSHLTFGADLPRRPGDYGIETVNGMAWLVRALEADETLKRRKAQDETLHIQRLMPLDALRIHGRHNATNALAALALAAAAGCALAPMLHGLREYRGEPHRVESIALLDGIEYFDDSKGTNVGATAAALAGLGADRKLVVILGGVGKGQDFSLLAEPVARHARAVVLIGRDAPLIRAALKHCQVALLDAASMEEAVSLAAAQARSGDAVLLSPACASFDMFDDYAHRAQVFCQAVQALADEQGIVL